MMVNSLCKMCEMQICADKRYIVTQHFKINKYSKLVNKKTNNINPKVQQIVTSTKKSSISFDLCKALMLSNISLNKISS